jgi:hypothetical protein
MAKKAVTVSLRRPKQAEEQTPLVVGTPTTPTLADAFVDSTAYATTRAQQTFPASFGTAPSSIPGRVVVTVQLPQELASRMLVRCLDEDRDASSVVAELVRGWVEGPRTEPEFGWRDVVRWASKAVRSSLPFATAFGR